MSQLKLRLTATLNNLGKTKRTMPPDSQDPIDLACHEFKLAEIGRAYFNERYDESKTNLNFVMGLDARDKLEKTKDVVKKTHSSSSSTLAEGQEYNLIVRVNPGASYVNMDGLKRELEGAFENLDFDLIVKKHTQSRSPTVTYIVTEK